MLFSSGAGTLGNPGQGNYAAANAYLDALAQLRHHQGLPATSIAWGLWETASAITGQLGDRDHRRLTRAGMRPLTTPHALQLLDHAVTDPAPVLTATNFHRPTLGRLARDHDLPPILVTLAPTTRPTTAHTDTRDRLASLAGMDAAERPAALLELVRSSAATALGLAEPELVGPKQAFKDLGVESLTAVELRNQLAHAAGTRLPATLVFDRPTPKRSPSCCWPRSAGRPPPAGRRPAGAGVVGERGGRDRRRPLPEGARPDRRRHRRRAVRADRPGDGELRRYFKKVVGELRATRERLPSRVGMACRLLSEAREWDVVEGRPRRAAVSSFGVSGTNAHVVLEEPPPATPESSDKLSEPAAAVPVVPIVLSARSEGALRDGAARLAGRLDGGAGLVDVGWPLVTSRAVHEHRAVVVAADVVGDPAAAADRDTAMRAARRRGTGEGASRSVLQPLSKGCLLRRSDGRRRPPAGELMPQGRVARRGATGRFDEVVGRGFALIAAGDVSGRLGVDDRAFLDRIGAHVAHLADHDLVDLDGVYRAFLDEHGVVAVLVRPDFYVFGAAGRIDDVAGLVAALGDRLDPGDPAPGAGDR